METIGNESKAKRFGKAAIDIVSFAALAVIIITITVSYTHLTLPTIA